MSALDNLIIDGMISPDVWRDARAELAALRASIAELEAQSATLTPRQCNRLCFERGFEAEQRGPPPGRQPRSGVPGAGFVHPPRRRLVQPHAEPGRGRQPYLGIQSSRRGRRPAGG